jgi:hypothetical protein
MFSKFHKIAQVVKWGGQFGNFENTSEINPLIVIKIVMRKICKMWFISGQPSAVAKTITITVIIRH